MTETDYFDRVERQLVRRVEERGHGRARRSPRAPVGFQQLGFAAALLVVVVVVAVFLGVRGHGKTASPGTGRGAEVVFRAVALDPHVPLGTLVERAIPILRRRLDSAVRGVRVAATGNEIVVTAPKQSEVAQIVALSASGVLDFYDWEANALITSGPSAGKTVASGLRAADPAAVLISQGSATAAPGGPGVGSLFLYQAVELAHKQAAARPRYNQSHLGPDYYLFGAPGSAACRLAAQAEQAPPALGEPCLLAGPGNSVSDIAGDLSVAFGDRVKLSRGLLLTVPEGTVVVQAVDPDSSKPVPANAPAAQFYVLRDRPSLQAPEITNPRESTDESGGPDVHFAFTSRGQLQFRQVTKQIAKRGGIGPPGQNYDQHFAVVLDGKLITVPSIDFHQYPDGISGRGGAEITGGFTRTSAKDLAAVLRFGALPVRLVLQ